MRVLMLDTTRWPLGGRLAARLIALGCDVATVRLPKGYPGDAVSGIQRRYRYNGFNVMRSIRSAIQDFRPNLVVPVGDRDSQHLRELHAWARARGDQQTVQCIECSIGPPESYPIVASRYEFLRMAGEEGVRIPAMQPVSSEADLGAFARVQPFPWVIKADGSWGGQGVVQAKNAAEARRISGTLGKRPGMVALLSRLATNRDRAIHFGDWRRPAPAILAQSWIQGWPATCAVVSWKGEVLAATAVEVKATTSATGPSRMVEVVEGAEMLEAARRVAARLQLSGFFGLDFMIDHTGAAYLIEMNSRCTPCCGLRMGKGHNLPEALFARFTGTPEADAAPCTTLKKVVHFPYRKWGASKPVTEAADWYYDVPTDAPEMIDRLLYPWRERSLFGLLVDRVRGFRSSSAQEASVNTPIDPHGVSI